ncbi:bifunctional phosphoglucose/phosphomannose isomerase [Candidatus Bathyarchaeota archaeon]|nr:bifunctional phosphoglucose/phosphomannose isomerase [Candidatus Bathyarchaeota archaeon]
MSSTTLDNPNEIKRIDQSNMLSFCLKSHEHCQEAAKLALTVPINYSNPQAIVIAGAGGSAIGGELLKDWAMDRINIPIEVCRQYSLPAYVNEKTLIFVVSYSGETEETLGMFLDAIRRNCMIFCISSGGRLLKIAEQLNLPYLRVPSGMPPRAALPYLFLPMLIILAKLGLVSDVNSEISEAIEVLEKAECDNSAETPLSDSFSKVLASKINGTVPVVYGFGIYRAVAQRYKQQFNENSKVPAKWEFFPELNHNELVGWEAAKELTTFFSAIFIRDRAEPEEIKQRIEVTKELIFEDSQRISEVWIAGEGRLAKMLYAVYIGDLASVYLAILRGVDPTPVKTISLLKEKITQSGVKERVIDELQKLCEK